MQPTFVRQVLESFELTALRWKEGRLHLYCLVEGDPVELIGIYRRLAIFGDWIGLRTNTSTFREMAVRILLRINPLINQASPIGDQWEMESVEGLSESDLDRYHQLIELPMRLLTLPRQGYPSIPLPPQMEPLLCELLLGMQRHIESLRDSSL